MKFPFRDFDPTNYVVPGPSLGNRHHNNNTEMDNNNYSSGYHDDDADMTGVQNGAANGHVPTGEWINE